MSGPQTANFDWLYPMSMSRLGDAAISRKGDRLFAGLEPQKEGPPVLGGPSTSSVLEPVRSSCHPCRLLVEAVVTAFLASADSGYVSVVATPAARVPWNPLPAL